ncbi:unnamed protein product [Larinioides sclopetarius]|uniref:Uncharacterized protein n=1 Tax=Larinioides sclopetarius TaxID=280406 RepID=A0AAV2AKR8_9ARAC
MNLHLAKAYSPHLMATSHPIFDVPYGDKSRYILETQVGVEDAHGNGATTDGGCFQDRHDLHLSVALNEMQTSFIQSVENRHKCFTDVLDTQVERGRNKHDDETTGDAKKLNCRKLTSKEDKLSPMKKQQRKLTQMDHLEIEMDDLKNQETPSRTN